MVAARWFEFMLWMDGVTAKAIYTFIRAHGNRKMQHICYALAMNSKQMKKWLEQQGATFMPGKGSHLKVFLNGRQSALPMHGTTELGKGLEAAIKRQLGLK